jgi:hypothetical protein
LVGAGCFGRRAVPPAPGAPRPFNLQPSVARLTIAGGAAEVEIIALA